MQVWNVLHVARWKYRTQKIAKNSPSGHHCTILSRYIVATKAHRQSEKKLVKQQHLLHMSSQYGELQPTNGWELLARLGQPSKFQRVSRLGSVTARHSSSGHQPKFVALNKGRHLHSEGRPSRWALAHILVYFTCDVNMTSLSHSWLMSCDSVCRICGEACSSRWLMKQLLNNGQHTCVLVFVPMVDILNIACDCQFVFSVLDELYVSHHAWCSG